jgi:heterotetrameric sarcosine oxidase gamma subunit
VSARPRSSLSDCRLEPQPSESVLEFAAFGFPLGGAFVVGWPAPPGAVRRDGDGRPVLLHFAPARWLVPAPHPDIAALLEAATAAGAGSVIDVEGKWTAFRLVGPGAGRLLASSVDVEPLLAARDCAAVTVFDCPGVLARVPDGFAIWVRASYAADFVTAVGLLLPRA